MNDHEFPSRTETPADPVESWGVEGIAAAIDHGDVQDWQKIVDAVMSAPNGKVADDLEGALKRTENEGASAYLRRKLDYARMGEKQRFALKFRRWMRESGLSRTELANYLGTSRSRLSTYATGKVVPSAITAEKVRDLGEQRRRYLAP